MAYSIACTSGAAAISRLDAKIDHEQIRLIYSQGSVLALGALLCALMLTLFLWQRLPRPDMLLWFAILAVSCLIRLLVIRAYQRAGREIQNKAAWGRLFWIGTLFAGLIWGCWPLLFYDYYGADYLLLISTVFAGMVAASAAAGSIYLPAFPAFSVPLVLPLAFSHLRSGSDTLAVTGVLLLMFLAVNWFLAARGNRQFRELIRARYENHELMARLEQEKATAERAVVAKSRFLAAASHDLRQPLHAMGLFMSALRHRENDARKLEIIDDMSKSADALNGLFNSLLDVSRLDADIIVVEPVHIPVRELFDRLRAQFRQQAAAKRLDLIISGTDAALYTDAILFERVLRNLLANAIQYTETGRIELGCRQIASDTVMLELSDTGIGIPESACDDVFTEYFQINNPERDRRKGLGLGLSIVTRLCKLLDVELSMQSTVGTGTRFELVVPAGHAAAERRVAASSIVSTPSHLTVLVIDDERQVLSSMQRVLEQWGCRALIAETTRDALKLIAIEDAVPDLIISDYRLRANTNGIDAIAALRESLGKSIPAVLVTGDTGPDWLKTVAASDLKILHKPVSADALKELLDGVAGFQTARRQSIAKPAESEPA